MEIENLYRVQEDSSAYLIREDAEMQRMCREALREVKRKKLEQCRNRDKVSGAEEQESESYDFELVLDTVFSLFDDLSMDEYVQIVEYVVLRTESELGVLDLFLQDDDVSEVMVNGSDRIFLETPDGLVSCGTVFDSTEELEECIRKIAAGVHREINEMNPILDARLPDGSRVNAVYKNIALDGPALTIRKFGRTRLTAEDLVRNGTMTQSCAETLKFLTVCGYNLFISGGTSTGKTTFLNALTDYIPDQERVIIIEDSRELMLDHLLNQVQMECRQANSAGKGKISMAELIRTSLRMRPDRIIVGEVRGAETALMLQALNTGHSGLCTGHGNSVRGMLRRLEAMCLMNDNIPIDAIRSQIVEALDIMVHLVRLPDGRRAVFEIDELIGFENGDYVLNPLYSYDAAAGEASSVNRVQNREKLQLRGCENERSV